MPESDLLGWRWLEVLHPDDREPTRRFWTDSVAGRGPYDVEYRVRRSDGEYRWFKTRGTPIRDSDRQYRQMVRDLHRHLRPPADRGGVAGERGAVPRDVRERRRRHRPQGLHGRFLRVNEKFCAIVGYSREELLQKTIRDITHPDDLAASIDAFAALWRGESPGFTLEKRYVRKDGSLVWVELFVSLQRDAAGKPAYDIGIVQDISERKRLEEELRAARSAGASSSTTPTTPSSP